jgi:hypothetical protein
MIRFDFIVQTKFKPNAASCATAVRVYKDYKRLNITHYEIIEEEISLEMIKAHFTFKQGDFYLLFTTYAKEGDVELKGTILKIKNCQKEKPYD